MQLAIEKTAPTAPRWVGRPAGPRTTASARPAPASTMSGPDLTDRVMISVLTLKIADFIALDSHPRQRDTERHAEEAKRRHLAHASPAQASVAVGEFQGKRYKLDGHTRALLWSRGELRPPKKLDVKLYRCFSFEDLLELYNHFDNKHAVETTPDTLSGALRQNNVFVTSKLMKRYGFASALRVASRAFGTNETLDVYVNVKEFAEELRMLDSLDPAVQTFKVGIVAGALVALRRHGAKVLPFFEALNANAGVKNARNCDAVYALHDVIFRPDTRRASGFSRTLEFAEKTLSAVERWLKNETYTVGKTGIIVRRSKIGDYLKGLKTETGA